MSLRMTYCADETKEKWSPLLSSCQWKMNFNFVYSPVPLEGALLQAWKTWPVAENEWKGGFLLMKAASQELDEISIVEYAGIY